MNFGSLGFERRSALNGYEYEYTTIRPYNARKSLHDPVRRAGTPVEPHGRRRVAVHPVLDALEETLGGERRLVVVLVALLDVADPLGLLGVPVPVGHRGGIAVVQYAVGRLREVEGRGTG